MALKASAFCTTKSNLSLRLDAQRMCSESTADLSDAVLDHSPRSRLVEGLLRAVAVLSYIYMLGGMTVNWWATHRPWSLMALMVTEGFTLLLILFAKPAIRRDASPVMVLAVVYSSAFFLLLEPQTGIRLISEEVSAAIQVASLFWVLAAKAAIGRAFGILPAARGLIRRGPYRVVRHPMYLGYLIGNMAFLAANASGRNAMVLSALLLVQVLRILREEEVLKNSSFGTAYRIYSREVRFRLIPPIF